MRMRRATAIKGAGLRACALALVVISAIRVISLAPSRRGTARARCARLAAAAAATATLLARRWRWVAMHSVLGQHRAWRESRESRRGRSDVKGLTLEGGRW